MSKGAGFINGRFECDKPYLMVVYWARIDWQSTVKIEVDYYGLSSPKDLKLKKGDVESCIYRVSDGVPLMWTYNFFSRAEMVINPLAYEYTGEGKS